jgi:hypothetical protein
MAKILLGLNAPTQKEKVSAKRNKRRAFMKKDKKKAMFGRKPFAEKYEV